MSRTDIVNVLEMKCFCALIDEEIGKIDLDFLAIVVKIQMQSVFGGRVRFNVVVDGYSLWVTRKKVKGIELHAVARGIAHAYRSGARSVAAR